MCCLIREPHGLWSRLKCGCSECVATYSFTGTETRPNETVAEPIERAGITLRKAYGARIVKLSVPGSVFGSVPLRGRRGEPSRRRQGARRTPPRASYGASLSPPRGLPTPPPSLHDAANRPAAVSRRIRTLHFQCDAPMAAFGSHGDEVVAGGFGGAGDVARRLRLVDEQLDLVAAIERFDAHLRLCPAHGTLDAA